MTQLSLYFLTCTTILVFGTLGGIFFYQIRKKDPLAERLCAAILPFSLLVILAVFVTALASVPFSHFAGARLAMSYALKYGYSVLFSQTEGPVGTWMYGPIAPYAYLPATVMSTPTSALIFGGVISYFFYFIPAGYVFYLVTRKKENAPLWATFFFSLFLLLSQLYFASESSWNGVHVDPIAFGFVTLAGAMLCFSEVGYRELILSSLFVSLAVWTKQTFFPALFAFCFCTFLMSGLNKFLKHVFIQISVFVAVTCLLAFHYSWDVLLFNTVYYPASFPWRASLFDPSRGYVPTSDHFGVFKSFVSFGYELYGLLAPFWAVVLLVFLVLFASKKLRLKEMFPLNAPFTYFFILSLCLVPTSILGRVKYGGAENCLNPALCFTLLSVLLLLLGILSSADAKTKGYGQMITALVFSFLLFGSVMKFPDLYTRMQAVTRLNADLAPQDKAFDLAKKYPHQVYFPWYPLPTLMAEGKFYHYAIGVGDRNMSRFPVGQEHFMQHLPSEMKWVAFFDQDHNILVRLKDFSEEVTPPDFAGFTVFEKKQAN